MWAYEGDGDEAVSVSDYVVRLRTDLRQQPAHERRRWLFFELKNLVLKNSKNSKPSLVDIARFEQLPVTHQQGGELVASSAAAPGPAICFMVAPYCSIFGIVPVSDLDVDLEYTALGLVFAKADVVCEYVIILAKPTEEAEVKNSQTHGAAWMRYGRVTPIFGSQTPFAVEGVTPISRVLQFEMSDGEPRLLVGTPTKSGTQITLLAERIFRVKTSDVEIYEKEMQAVHQTLQGDKIQPVASKRPAEAMIEETPPKKFAPAFLDQ